MEPLMERNCRETLFSGHENNRKSNKIKGNKWGQEKNKFYVVYSMHYNY